jgi:DNA (cytosine-5)-methyltransferase 1
MFSLQTSKQHGVAVSLRGRNGGATAEITEGAAPTLRASQGGGDKPHVLTSAVRRLTPVECERLQGFPENYTLIPVGKKFAADGPRYKALGNSMAVPVMRWIGQRIEETGFAEVSNQRSDGSAYSARLSNPTRPYPPSSAQGGSDHGH